MRISREIEIRRKPDYDFLQHGLAGMRGFRFSAGLSLGWAGHRENNENDGKKNNSECRNQSDHYGYLFLHVHLASDATSLRARWHEDADNFLITGIIVPEAYVHSAILGFRSGKFRLRTALPCFDETTTYASPPSAGAIRVMFSTGAQSLS